MKNSGCFSWNLNSHIKVFDAELFAIEKVFTQIERLSNTKRELSFQAIRQLYIACISLVADYEVPVYWNNQKCLLEKFQKL